LVGHVAALLIFGFLCDCVLFAGLCYAINAFYHSADGKKITNENKVLSLLGLTFLLLGQIFSAIYVITVKLPSGTVNSGTMSLWSVYNAFWSIGYTFTYALYYVRIEQAFRNSAYALSALHSFVFFALLLVYFATQMSSCTMWILYELGSIQLTTYSATYSPILWTRVVVDFFLNYFSIGMFSSKILSATITFDAETGKASYVTKSSSAIFEMMIRTFLLTLCTVASTTLLTVSEIVLSESISYATRTDNYDFYNATYSVYFALGAIDSLMVMSFILLTFSFNKRFYDKLCAFPHSLCLWLWARCEGLEENDTKKVAKADGVVASQDSAEPKSPSHTQTELTSRQHKLGEKTAKLYAE